MICTIKIVLTPEDVGFKWNIKKLISKFGSPKKFENGKKPLFMVGNFLVFGWDKELKITGSLAKYYNGNNVDNFDWRHVKTAITLLSNELGLPLEKGKISRIDIGVNFEVEEDVTDYFQELFHLEYYQRIRKKKTTLRFENNSHPFNYCFYDKIKEIRGKKLIEDFDLKLLSNVTNLMRVELQIQERMVLFLKKEDVRVSDLFSSDFCKLLMKKWLELYQNIHKEAILVYPKKLKGNADFEKFMKRYFVQILGWNNLDYLMKGAVKQKSLSAPDKSKKLKQFRIAMLDNSNFEFQEHTLELNHKIKVMYVKALMQIFRMN